MRIQKIVAMLALVYSCHVLAVEQSDTVMLNFVNADIETVVKAIGEITGKNFVIDPRVKGTVNIVSSKPVPRDLSYQILLSSLRLQGFSAVEGNGIVKIVPEADAKLHAKSSQRITRGDGDRLVTKVFILKNGNANQLVPVLRPIISPNNTLSAYPLSNALIVTDYAENIQRIESIIESIESAAAGDTVVLPVQFGSAVELAGTLSKLMQDGGDGSKTVIIADARSNVLMLRADSPGRIGKIKSLLKLLDQPSQAGANVRVVYLRNAEAAKVAQTLRVLLSSDGGQVQQRSTMGSGNAAGSGLLNDAAASSSNLGSNSTASATPLQDPRAAANSPGGSGASSSTGGGGLMIQADTNSNALILNVPDAMYQNLRNVIDLLDKRRAQVFVEALVIEVSASRAMELGVQWQGVKGNVFGGTNFPSAPGILGATGSTLAGQGGMTIGVLNGTINIPGIGEVLNLGVLARALETEAQGNVVASPQLTTMDNEKAKIVIGQEVPILTGQYSNNNSNGGNQPFSTYDRKTIGFALEITPQISEGGAIRMKISQEASSIDPATANDPRGPSTNKRLIDTAVTVDDGGIVALGGLTQETVSTNEDKVPLLGDIPYLGQLFRYQNKSRKKTNLMVFIKPTIIRDDLGSRAIAGDRYNYLIGDTIQNERKKMSLDPVEAFKMLPEGSIRSTLEQQIKAAP
ncbi:type II secretion system secretin GspD [Neisseriaceae bacterium TC5R-5]|nr:type II secretion system secretin GspD [Neisseriaceae bacterium TC5R-5]